MIRLVYPEKRLVSKETVMNWARDFFVNGVCDHEPKDLDDAICILEDAGEIIVSHMEV